MQVKPFLCAGDSDSAAKILIAVMTDPATRDTMIAFMQDELPPISVSNRDDAFIAALLALKNDRMCRRRPRPATSSSASGRYG